MLSDMFVVSEAEAAAIRAVYEQHGELSAAVEIRRRFPGIISTAQATECARIIAGWRTLPKLPSAQMQRRERPRAARPISIAARLSPRGKGVTATITETVNERPALGGSRA